MLRILILLFSTIGILKAQTKVKGCWQPNYVPVEFCLDSNGNFETKTSRSITTHLGRFKLQAGYSEPLYRDYAAYYSDAKSYTEGISYAPTFHKTQVYIQYNDFVHVFQIHGDNELVIESSKGINARFRQGIVYVSITSLDSTKIIFNNLETYVYRQGELEYPVTTYELPYPEKALKSLDSFLAVPREATSNTGRSKVHRDELGYVIDPFSAYWTSKTESFDKVVKTNRTFDLFDRPTSRTTEYYLNSTENSQGYKVLRLFEEIDPLDSIVYTWNSEVYFNPSTYQFFKRYKPDYLGLYRFFGRNHLQIFEYVKKNLSDYDYQVLLVESDSYDNFTLDGHPQFDLTEIKSGFAIYTEHSDPGYIIYFLSRTASNQIDLIAFSQQRE